MEELSRYVSHTLDGIGYNGEIVKIRRNYWQTTPLYKSTLKSSCFMPAGSKGEGITSKFESDIDTIVCSHDIICTDNVRLQSALQASVVFKVDIANASPGYTRLELFRMRGSHRLHKCFLSYVDNCLYEEKSDEGSSSICASSTLFLSGMRRANIMNYNVISTSGPACQIIEGPLSLDTVFAFHCFCPKVLQPFRTRHRQHDWPPEEIIHDPSHMLCQLVPVGCKGSSDQWKEWRFCFILTEQKLVFSLNDTQLKMYIILKMIKKDILKSVSEEISSYIMKNVTFWIAEICGSHCFREENLLSLVLIGLKFLKDAIDNYYLPYYMIPTRNLLAERLEPRTRRRLTDVLSQLLKEGPRFVLCCSKLRDGMVLMYKSPESFKTYSHTKYTVEVLRMLQDILDVYKVKRSFDQREIRKQKKVVSERLHDILAPECVMGLTPCAYHCAATRAKRLNYFLS